MQGSPTWQNNTSDACPDAEYQQPRRHLWMLACWGGPNSARQLWWPTLFVTRSTLYSHMESHIGTWPVTRAAQHARSAGGDPSSAARQERRRGHSLMNWLAAAGRRRRRTRAVPPAERTAPRRAPVRPGHIPDRRATAAAPATNPHAAGRPQPHRRAGRRRVGPPARRSLI